MRDSGADRQPVRRDFRHAAGGVRLRSDLSLVVEKIGTRFPHYHPGFFNGIFSLALTGGMLAPAILGYASEYFGIQIVMALPMIGSVVVVVLVLLIWLEAKLAAPDSTGATRSLFSTLFTPLTFRASFSARSFSLSCLTVP